MDPERPDSEEVADVLQECVEVPYADRPAFLDRRCAGRRRLRDEVESLLGFLPDPELEGVDHGDDEEARAMRRVGREIGGCRLLELIAIGGMGAVYRAEQESPRREVAVKVLRPDGLGTDAWRRLKREALALGRLDHPAIARVLTAGIHRDEHGATPYLTMELVDGGRPITEWWSSTGLTLRERLDRFATICEAIHHGHMKGVLHRDVKPTNLLVDREERPKVIDFGIARVLEPGTDGGTAPVTAGRVIGTIGYMGPERLEGGGEVDVRSDVYGLGVVLYELLAGRMPFGGSMSLAQSAAAIARGGIPHPSTFNRHCRGDLDAIVATAMAAHPDDRYDSASALAADLRAHLADEPVRARGVGGIAALRKFLSRNRIAVAAAAGVFLALSLGLAFSLRATARAERALFLSLLARGELMVNRGELRVTLDVLNQIDPIHDGYWPVQVLRSATSDAVDSAGFMDWQPARGRLDARRECLLACGSGEHPELVVFGVSPPRVLWRIPLPASGMAADWGPPAADGIETVIAGLADGRIIEVRTTDGTILRELDRVVPEDPSEGQVRISDLALDPAGRWLAIGCSQDSVRLLDMSEGIVRNLGGFGYPPISDRVSLEWDREGRSLAVAASGGTYIVEPESSATSKLSSQASNHAVFSPDGKRVATALRAGGSEVIDLETGDVRLICPAEWPLWGVDWSPDGEQVAIVGQTHWIIACEISTGRRRTLKSAVNLGLAVRWLTDEEFIVLPEGRVFSLRMPPLRMPQLARGIRDTDRGKFRLRFVEEGRSMVSAGPDGRIDRIDPLLMTRSEILRVPVTVPSTDATHDGEVVVVADGVKPGPLWLVRPREGTSREIDGAFLGPVAISPDARWVVACGPAGTAVVVDAVSGHIETRHERSADAPTTAFAWLDADRILWCLSQGRILLERDAGGAWSRRHDPAATVNEAWAGRDGDWFWTDRSQRFGRSVPDRIGDPNLPSWFSQEGIVLCVASHPTLPLVALGRSDGRIMVLDESLGAQVASFYPMSLSLTDLAWSPDGSMLASIDFGGGISVFHGTPLSKRWPEIERRRRLAPGVDADRGESPRKTAETELRAPKVE